MKKPHLLFIVMFVLMVSSVTVLAQQLPDNIQTYAEEIAFPNFLKMADRLHLGTTVKSSDLVLGEGFSVRRMSDNLFTAEKFSDLIGDETMWLYLINEPDGSAISFLQIYDLPEKGLDSGGGGDSLFFSQSANKMRELIRKFGRDDDFQVVSYGYNDYFFFYSFGGDERVIYANPTDYNEAYLNVSDYHELPTGDEAIAAMREEQQYYHQLIEEKGTLSFLDMPIGGTDPQLSLHRYTSPTKITLTVLVAVLLLVMAGIVLNNCIKRLKENKQNR